MAQPANLIFWGAGATAALGIRTTAQQAEFVRKLTSANNSRTSLNERIMDALGPGLDQQWYDALQDLITILGDTEDAYRSIHIVSDEQMETMRRNWRPGAANDELQRRIFELRLIYDWPALKSVVRICPASGTSKFKLNDLFNVLDTHIPFRFGFRAPADRERAWDSMGPGEQFFDAFRLTGARNALFLILTAQFYIDYRTCVTRKRDVIDKYYGFVLELGRRARRLAIQNAASGKKFDTPDFYESEVGFVSLNYDPIMLWLQFCAHRELNAPTEAPSIGSPAVPLHLYHDFGHLIPARGIERDVAQSPWYPLNEAAAQRLNDQRFSSGYRAKVCKFLFPHGCLCWRECPDCGKLSAFHGDQWNIYSDSLFPPPPLLAFDRAPCADRMPLRERMDRDSGIVDARACLHCGTLSYAHHTQAIMQTSFKERPPSFIEEIERDLRATTMQANHIIFMGYSLPPDDVTYRAFFSARRQRDGRLGSVRCTVVDLDRSNPGWYGPSEMKKRSFKEGGVVDAARELFGDDNVRFFGSGVPAVFIAPAGHSTEQTVERLLTWS